MFASGILKLFWKVISEHGQAALGRLAHCATGRVRLLSGMHTREAPGPCLRRAASGWHQRFMTFEEPPFAERNQKCYFQGASEVRTTSKRVKATMATTGDYEESDESFGVVLDQGYFFGVFYNLFRRPSLFTIKQSAANS
jgi:hypothetical protein